VDQLSGARSAQAQVVAKAKADVAKKLAAEKKSSSKSCSQSKIRSNQKKQ